jgi:LuxR family maltose regulon positive regulatory protein
VRYGQQALDLLPENDNLRRGIAASLLGVAYYVSGDLEMAHRTLAEGMADLQTAGNLLFAIRGTYILADIRLAQGRLQDAIRTYEQSLQLAAEQGESVLRGTADLYLRLSEVYVEQNNLDAATELRLRSEELGEQKASPIWQYRLCLARARIKQAEGDLESALDLLNEAERRYVRTPVPDIQPVGAMKARAWIMQGRLNEALAWVHEQGLSAADNLSFLHEFEHITLARVLIVQHKNGVEGAMHVAMRLLERLLEAAEVGGRNGSMIEILVQQALAYEAQDNIHLALAPLERALSLAEPEGYIRTFVDERQPMAYLLSQAIEHGIMPRYARTLLNTLETTAGSALPPASQALIEPLSERELEILALVADGLSNREISERLFVALSTVKGHNRNIFDKLYVKRRTEAVARARELGLIE